MTRAKLVVAAVSVAIGSFAAISGSAMADDLNCSDAQGDWISCDGTYYAPVDSSGGWTPYNNGYGDPYNNGYWDPNGMASNNGYGDWGLFGPCGLFGTYDPLTGACY